MHRNWEYNEKSYYLEQNGNQERFLGGGGVRLELSPDKCIVWGPERENIWEGLHKGPVAHRLVRPRVILQRIWWEIMMERKKGVRL